jgi:dTDP-4-amino-4,6-dideoxygalactose transaminase
MLQKFREKFVIDLGCIDGVENKYKLIRHPVLLNNRNTRDKIYEECNRLGLGVTKMYERPLFGIEGLEELLSNQKYCPNSIDFADRLITLPVHS